MPRAMDKFPASIKLPTLTGRSYFGPFFLCLRQLAAAIFLQFNVSEPTTTLPCHKGTFVIRDHFVECCSIDQPSFEVKRRVL